MGLKPGEVDDESSSKPQATSTKRQASSSPAGQPEVVEKKI